MVMWMKKSIIDGDSADRCFLCGCNRPAHVHHVLHGSRRAMADRYGLTVHLCVRCHTRLHDLGEHDLELERIGQQAFEKNFGHEKFMQIFGKDYTG